MLAAPANRGGGAAIGVFALLDEQCRLPKCTHKTFTEKIFEVPVDEHVEKFVETPGVKVSKKS